MKTTRHPKRKESGGGKQQTLFPMKSAPKEVEVEETMIETTSPTEEMEVEVESEELQEAQASSIVGDSLVCPSFSYPRSPLSSLLLDSDDCVVPPSPDDSTVSSDS